MVTGDCRAPFQTQSPPLAMAVSVRIADGCQPHRASMRFDAVCGTSQPSTEVKHGVHEPIDVARLGAVVEDCRAYRQLPIDARR